MPVCYHVYEKRTEKMKGNVNTTKKEKNTNTSFIERKTTHICYRSLILERSTTGTRPSRSFLGQHNLFKVLMIHRPFLSVVRSRRKVRACLCVDVSGVGVRKNVREEFGKKEEEKIS